VRFSCALTAVPRGVRTLGAPPSCVVRSQTNSRTTQCAELATPSRPVIWWVKSKPLYAAVQRGTRPLELQRFASVHYEEDTVSSYRRRETVVPATVALVLAILLLAVLYALDPVRHHRSAAPQANLSTISGRVEWRDR
jgi:hypothetical protein